MSVVKQALFMVPLMLILPLFMGIDGVLAAYSVSDFCSVLIIGAMYLRGLRKVKRYCSLRSQ